jgi:hypothetical protein
MPRVRRISYRPGMPGDVLTLLCGRCRSVKRVDVGELDVVPFWVTQLLEAFGQAEVHTIRVPSCHVCLELPAPRDEAAVLAELKRMLEGR